MAESQAPGTSSSSPSPVTSDDAIRALKELADSELLSKILNTLGADSQCHLVGGIVRDTFLGCPRQDIDMASLLLPEAAAAKLTQAGYHVVETGIEHGTITVVSEGKNIELTTFRTPSARNETAYSESIATDLSGRDFTINAIAFDPFSGTIIDPHSGIDDLRDRKLRAVGDAESRILEDPHRILRAVRFGPAAGRVFEPTLESSLELHTQLLKNISIERIRDEIVKILCAPEPVAGIECLRKIQVLDLFLPEILPSIGFEQNEFHIHDVYEHTLWVIERTPATELLRLSALFHDLGKPHTLTVGEDGRRHFYKHEQVSEDITKSVMKRMRFSKKFTEQVSTVVRYHMRPLDCGPAGTRRLMRDLEDLFDDWLLFKRADMPPVMTDEEFQTVYDEFMALVTAERDRTSLPEYGHLAVNGNDLIQVGMSPGKKLGAVLKQLEEVVIEDPSQNMKEPLLELAKKLYKEL